MFYFKVTQGQDALNVLTINATDYNMDTLQYRISKGPPRLTIDANGRMSWRDVSYEDIDDDDSPVEVTVSDGVVDTVVIPQLRFCNCQNGGNPYVFL